MENRLYEFILVRYGELSTKGKNRKDFIKKLLDNTKNRLMDFSELEYEKTYDRMYIRLNGADAQAVCEALKDVFGISSFSLAMKINSDIEEIKKATLEVAKEAECATFKMMARRHDKLFPMMSDDINRICATQILQQTQLKVDVKKPELRIIVEVRQDCTYIMSQSIKGAGGYPVGIGGKGMLMLSGGIDSPVAGYMTQKRGVMVECIHYASPPYTSSSAQQKMLDLAKVLSKYQGRVRVHVVPFTKLQLAIYEHCDESYTITIMRRMMYRIAQKVAEKNKALAIVNGESVGQVASQTLESMMVINDVTNYPVLRPVVGLDKLEIIDIANKIGSYEISIQPFEDCCTIFTPKNPVTKPTLKRAEKMERKFDWDTLIEECIENIDVKIVYPTEKDENIF